VVSVVPQLTELLARGATVQLRAKVLDQKARVMTDVSVSWSSNDASVASVDGSGLVTAIANGSATITATAGTASGHASVAVFAITERAALTALYNATDGPNWVNADNWRTDMPLGDWYGVEVNEDGRVTGLHLGGWDDAAQDFIDHGLTGSLPPEVGTLSHLRRLEIGGNAGLVGPLPAELSSLTRLAVLNLQANRLAGPIPPGLGHLPDLEELWLSRNPLRGIVKCCGSALDVIRRPPSDPLSPSG